MRVRYFFVYSNSTNTSYANIRVFYCCCFQIICELFQRTQQYNIHDKCYHLTGEVEHNDDDKTIKTNDGRVRHTFELNDVWGYQYY